MAKLFLIGMPGAGKTTTAKLISEKLGIPCLDLDREIEIGEGRSISDIFYENSESYFREIERLYLHRLSSLEQFVVSTGGGTPVYFDNMEWINQEGKSIYLKQGIPEIIARISKNKHLRPLFNDLNEDELKDKLYELMEIREPYYKKAHYIIEENYIFNNTYNIDYHTLNPIGDLQNLPVDFL